MVFDPVRLTHALRLVSTAGGDLQAADVLRGERLHPQAVFALQQAVEKTVKAVGLELGIVQPEELHTAISHKSVKVFVRGLRLLINLAAEKLGPNIITLSQVDGAMRKLDADVGSFSRIGRPTAEEIDEWLSSLEDFRSRGRSIHDGRSGDELRATLRAEIGHGARLLSIDLDQLVDQLPRFFFELFVAGLALYYLSLATQAHAVTSRYGEGTQTPSDLYGDRCAVVARFDRLLAEADSSRRLVERALSLARSFDEQMSRGTRGSGTVAADAT